MEQYIIKQLFSPLTPANSACRQYDEDMNREEG